MSTLRVNTLENLSGNVQLTVQTINSTQQISNAAVALAIALGA